MSRWRGEAVERYLKAHFRADQPIVIAEVGVFHGRLTSHLLAYVPNIKIYYMIDLWAPFEADSRYVQSGDGSTLRDVDGVTKAFRSANKVTEFARDKRIIMAGSSVQMASVLQDESLDMVFIDADHSYEGTMEDLEAWHPKVKPDGHIAGHDYGNPVGKKWEVKRAVLEFRKAHNITGELILDDEYTWFMRKS